MKKHTKSKIRNLMIEGLRKRYNYLESKHPKSKPSNQMKYISLQLKKLEGGERKCS